MADTLSRAQLTPFRLTTIQSANQQSLPLSAPSGDSEQDSGGDQLVECIPGNKELFRQAKEVWKKSPYDCLLFDRGQGPKLLPTPSVDHLSYEERAIPVNRATLSALSAILHLYPHYQLKCRNRPTKIHHARAYTFLDNWHAALSDIQAKQVLNCYGLRTPEEQLVTSASSAGQAASRIGLPVFVKAVGPELHRYHQSVELRYDATNVAAARDAFRRLVQTCSQMQPLPLLDGVLVSKRVESVWGLHVILFWLPELPPLLYLDRPQQNKRIPSGQWLLRCPVSQDYAHRVAHHIIFSLSSGDRLISDGDENCAELSNAIWRLSWLGADLTGRMHWLRLSAAITNSPRGSFLLYFIDGYGSQTESLRSPNYG